MSNGLFKAPDTWLGGSYELGLEIRPRSDERLEDAIKALWTYPDLDGCYLHRDCEPGEQPRVAPHLTEGHLFGVARLPNGKQLASGCCPRREMDDGKDWLEFFLPLVALGTIYPTGTFPIGFGNEPPDLHEPWMREVDDWLAGIGLWVAERASFRLGLIGCDATGEVSASDIAARGIPARREIGYLWPSEGGMKYYPRTAPSG